MRLRKLLVLLATAGTLIAVAAPTAQGNSWWTTDTEEGEFKLGAPDPFTGKGKLTMTAAGGFSTGPMEAVEIKGFLGNEQQHGVGVITGAFLGVEVPTNIPGCKATEVFAKNIPWGVLLETETPLQIELQGVTITFVYNGICQAIGVPAVVSIESVLTGEYSNETGCLMFVNSGNLATEPNGAIAVKVDGFLCIKGTKGFFTANPKGGEEE